MKQTKHIRSVRTLQVKYLAWTNHRPCRVKITDPKLKQSVTITFHSYCRGESITETACVFLQEQHWEVIGRNEAAGIVLVADDYQRPLKSH